MDNTCGYCGNEISTDPYCCGYREADTLRSALYDLLEQYISTMKHYGYDYSKNKAYLKAGAALEGSGE